MKKLILLLAICLLIPMIAGDLGTFKQNDCVQIRVLSNCSLVNMTEISNENETFTINLQMTHLGGQTFNYTFCDTSFIGTYSYSWDDNCIDCSLGGCGNSFEINPTGKSLTIEKAITYVLIFIIGFIIFIGLLLIGIALPSSNKRDEITGYILVVSNLKYIKIICLSFAYLTAMVITFFSYIICYSYLDLDFLTRIFYLIFWFMVALVLPFLVIMAYLFIANWVRDNDIEELLSRGLRVS